MNTSVKYSAVAIGLFLAGTQVYAEKGATVKSQIAAVGAPVLQDQFDSDKLPSRWTASKGIWEVKDGAIVGKENPKDLHAAVLTLNHPNRNSVLTFSFKLAGAESFNLSFNHAKGHLFRIIVNDRKVSISKDKDKKDPKSKSRTLASQDVQLADNAWHTMQIEIVDDQVAIGTDKGVNLTAKDASLNVEKTGYRFVVRGGDFQLDDVTVSAVGP